MIFIDTEKVNNSMIIFKIKLMLMIGFSGSYFLSDIRNSQRISKEMVELTSPDLLSALELGKKFHECLEVLDLSNPDIEAHIK